MISSRMGQWPGIYIGVGMPLVEWQQKLALAETNNSAKHSSPFIGWEDRPAQQQDEETDRTARALPLKPSSKSRDQQKRKKKKKKNMLRWLYAATNSATIGCQNKHRARCSRNNRNHNKARATSSSRTKCRWWSDRDERFRLLFPVSRAAATIEILGRPQWICVSSTLLRFNYTICLERSLKLGFIKSTSSSFQLS